VNERSFPARSGIFRTKSESSFETVLSAVQTTELDVDRVRQNYDQKVYESKLDDIADVNIKVHNIKYDYHPDVVTIHTGEEIVSSDIDVVLPNVLPFCDIISGTEMPLETTITMANDQSISELITTIP